MKFLCLHGAYGSAKVSNDFHASDMTLAKHNRPFKRNSLRS
jgi:hypothetical protein